MLLSDSEVIFDKLENSALSGNRTPVSRVAGENSTTEPTMRGNWGFLEGVYRQGGDVVDTIKFLFFM